MEPNAPWTKPNDRNALIPNPVIDGSAGDRCRLRDDRFGDERRDSASYATELLAKIGVVHVFTRTAHEHVKYT